jgi:uncharacterized protein RhaS with RHS repeats
MGARVYDPYTGTFTQPDPIQGGGANAYGYTDGDPVNEEDLAGTNEEETDEFGGVTPAFFEPDEFGPGEPNARFSSEGAQIDDVGQSGFEQRMPPDGSSMSTHEALSRGEAYLGDGYSEPEAGSGRFVSDDGTKVFRMGDSDITGAHGGGPHVNFEALEPNPARPGRLRVGANSHVYLTDR